jgi:hypothetical protein
MISVADLLTNNRVPGSYFATDAYMRSDLELGLLENRRGDRLLASHLFWIRQRNWAGIAAGVAQLWSLVG